MSNLRLYDPREDDIQAAWDLQRAASGCGTVAVEPCVESPAVACGYEPTTTATAIASALRRFETGAVRSADDAGTRYDLTAIASALRRFETGAVRSADDAGTRYDLISPIGLRRVANACHEGAVKYSDYNWEKGMDIPSLLNHSIRHIYLYLSGDRSEDHLGHAAWNCMAACHSEEMWPHLNDKLRGPGCVPPGA